MPRFVTSSVTEMLEDRPGLQRVNTEVGRAYALVDVTGPVAVGDRVVLNTTAVDLGLGTGGWHVVHWNLARDEWSQPGDGHIMKLRYTSLQIDTGAAEEHRGEALAEHRVVGPGDPVDAGHRSPEEEAAGDDASDPRTRLDGLPIVVCSLHSQVAVVAAVARAARPGARIVYVMTDGAALPMALSDLVCRLKENGVVDRTVTAGHAFGGDLEAVTVPSALTLAQADGADLVIVGMGPGVVGTASPLGTTAVEAAAILDAAASLGAAPALCARASDGDARPRHQGLSHHVGTILELLQSTPALPLPPELADASLGGAGNGNPGIGDRHRHGVVAVEPPDVAAVLDEAGVRVTTMGRGPDADPLFFRAAGAAGAWAAAVLGGS